MTTVLRLLTAYSALRDIGLGRADAFLLALRGVVPIAGGADSEWTTGSPEAVKRWSRQAWVELPKLIYWNKFMGMGLNNVIQVKTELEAEARARGSRATATSRTRKRRSPPTPTPSRSTRSGTPSDSRAA